jgi:hypothetical protein
MNDIALSLQVWTNFIHLKIWTDSGRFFNHGNENLWGIS